MNVRFMNLTGTLRKTCLDHEKVWLNQPSLRISFSSTNYFKENDMKENRVLGTECDCMSCTKPEALYYSNYNKIDLGENRT